MERIHKWNFQFYKSWKNKYQSRIKFSDLKSKGPNIPNKAIFMNKISSMSK